MTQQRLITIAEQLFAERGVGGVSLREVAAAAGQRNHSATQYHFGSKQGLVEAVFRERMASINVRRLEVLEHMRAAGEISLRQYIEAFVEPLAESLGRHEGVSWYARFVAQVVFEPSIERMSSRLTEVTTGLRECMAGMERAMASLPPQVRAERIELAGALVVHGLANRERIMQARGVAPSSPALLAAQLVDAVEAIIAAPVSAETARELRAERRRSS